MLSLNIVRWPALYWWEAWGYCMAPLPLPRNPALERYSRTRDLRVNIRNDNSVNRQLNTVTRLDHPAAARPSKRLARKSDVFLSRDAVHKRAICRRAVSGRPSYLKPGTDWRQS